MAILVLGATGKTGRPVVSALAARGEKVLTAGRTSADVRFDWADRDTWQPALDGVDALYVVGPFWEPSGAGLVGELLAAAPAVRRVVLLSVLGADLLPDVVPMAAWERDVRASGKEWTILRPNWFQQNFSEGFATSLREKGTLELPAGRAAVSFVDTRDIGEVAAAALAEEGHAGQTYVLTGPEALDHHQALAILGRGLRYVELTEEEFAGQLRQAGADDRVVAWQLGLFSVMRDGRNAVVTDTVERITGRPARPLHPRAGVYPIIGYKDAPAMIEWLGRTFGFDQGTVLPGENGLIAHAELTLGGDAIVMLGSIQNDTLGLRVPREIGAMTGGVYVAVQDTKSHYEHARAAGAEIVQELTDNGFGLRYSALDPEGHLWGFGDYRPS